MMENKIVIKSDTRHLKDIRSRIRGIAEKSKFSEDEINNIVLAVDEACANIIRHAYKERAGGDIIIGWEEDAGKLTIKLEDHGVKPDLEKIKKLPREKVRCGGFGLVCMKKAMDEINFDISRPDKTILTLVKYKAKYGKKKKLNVTEGPEAKWI